MNESAKALLKQNRIFIAVVLSMILCVVAFSYMGVDGPEQKANDTRKIKVDLPTDKVSPQDIWMDKLDASNKLMEQKFKYLESVILDNKKAEIELSNEKMTLQNDVAYLRSELQKISEGKAKTVDSSQNPFVYEETEQSTEQEDIILRQPLQEMVMPASREKIHHVDEMIPAGTTVKALLVSSLDAVCGVYTISDPTPIKLRILDNAHLPKHVNVKLKGGIIIGSAYGNISNERVYMRLERLTQVQSNGDFVETGVTGYVSGEDGKYGVRGEVVDKSTKAVVNAAASGFLSGVSQSLQAACGRKNFDSKNNYNFGVELAAQGGVNGSSNGLDMLADYYIKRAEQIQPVIEIDAGRIVDVTFTLGVSTGDFHAKETLKKIRLNNK